MSAPDAEFDVLHPSGQVMFRSCRGGSLHSVVLGETAMRAEAAQLARSVLRAAEVSHLKAVMRIRDEIIEAGFTPSAELPGPLELTAAEHALRDDRLYTG